MLRIQLPQKKTLKMSSLYFIVTLTAFFVIGSSYAADVKDSYSPSVSIASSEENDKAEELFLRHFISRSLQPQLESSKKVDESLNMPRDRDTSKDSKPLAFPWLESGPSAVTTAAVKMILSLGGVLLVLVLIAYFLRRSFMVYKGAGKSGATLRVTARAPVTAKCMVALIEVPGKGILIGVTGTSVTALGEILINDTSSHEEVSPPSSTFEESLEQYSKKSKSLDESEVNFITVQEAIQRKVSNLKRL